MRTLFRINRIGVSGDALPRPHPVGMVPLPGGLFAGVSAVPPPLPSWLTEADIDYYTREFTRTGFRGGLNWYRNIDRNWELLAPFDGLPVDVPALYIVGDRDPVIGFPGMRQHIADLPKFAPRLRQVIMLPGCGHITQEERSAEVSAAMIGFLRGLP